MEKVTTLGNSFMFAIAALPGSIKTWLNGKSEFFTALLNEGEDDYAEVSRLQVLGIHLGILALVVVIGLVCHLENI